MKIVDGNTLKQYDYFEQLFILLPLEHAEDKDIGNLAVLEAMRIDLKMKADPKCVKRGLNFEHFLNNGFVKHNEVIQKFGRYPYRNEAMNRKATPEEEEFLKSLKKEERFGQ